MGVCGICGGQVTSEDLRDNFYAEYTESYFPGDVTNHVTISVLHHMVCHRRSLFPGWAIDKGYD